VEAALCDAARADGERGLCDLVTCDQGGGVTSALPWLDAATIAEALPMRAAVDALEQALRAGLDPAGGPPRTVVTTSAGQLLLMPAEAGPDVGVKLIAVAPGNAARGLPTVQGVYLLLAGDTLTPLALLDGAALTSLRTAAVSAVAVAHLAAPEASRLVVFGTGPQAWGHVEAVAAVRPVDDVAVIGRDAQRTAAFVERLAERWQMAAVAGPYASAVAARDTAAVAAAVAAADVVVCATTAGTPLFDGRRVRPGACVVAVGTHTADRRELDAQLLARSYVVVEDVATALREAGDVVLAADEGALTAADLWPLAALVTSSPPPADDRPRVFKSVGMAWEDLVVAAAVHAAIASPR
jgi:ornithine cyclodeaminase